MMKMMTTDAKMKLRDWVFLYELQNRVKLQFGAFGQILLKNKEMGPQCSAHSSTLIV